MLQDSSYLFAINSRSKRLERGSQKLEVIHHKLFVVMRTSKSNWCPGQVWRFWRHLVLTSPGWDFPNSSYLMSDMTQSEYFNQTEGPMKWMEEGTEVIGRPSRFCSDSTVFLINFSLLYVILFSLFLPFYSSFIFVITSAPHSQLLTCSTGISPSWECNQFKDV